MDARHTVLLGGLMFAFTALAMKLANYRTHIVIKLALTAIWFGSLGMIVIGMFKLLIG